MFKLFQKKSKTARLNDEYKKLMSEWHKLSTIDRKASDEVYARAQEVLKKMVLEEA
jgi:hypothetical protein